MGIVELVQAVAWPVAVTLIAFWYRPAGPGLWNTLRELVGRDWKLAGYGVSVEARGASTRLQSETLEQPSLPASVVLEPSPFPALTVIETRVRKQVEDMLPERREPGLIRALAANQLMRGHEFVYNRIFGSQILGLKRLNEAGVVTIEDARSFFQPVAQAHPEMYRNYTFEQWLNFLAANELVEQHGDTLAITIFGRDFLRYLTDARMPEAKPF